MSTRAVLVTGGARRIGAAIVRRLHASGWRVVVHFNNSAAEAEALAAETEGFAIGADLADRHAAETLIPRVVARAGELHALVNNASSFPRDWPDRFDWTNYDAALRPTLDAPLYLTQALAEAGGETVVNLLDARLRAPGPDFFSYTVAKAGLAAATRATALHFGGRLRVNGVAPGLALRSGKQTDASFARAWAAAPLGRNTTPEEVAEAVRFFLETPGVNGQVLALDGGEGVSRAIL